MIGSIHVPRERARRPLMKAYAGKQFVGIDLHRRRTVIVRTTEAGEVLETVRIVNDVQRLASVMARAGDCPEVVLEATYGWYWAVDALQAGGATAHQGATRASTAQSQTRRATFTLQSRGPRRAGQMRGPGADERPVRAGRYRAVGPARAPSPLRGQDRLTAPADGRPGLRDQPVRWHHPRADGPRAGIHRGAEDPRHRPHPRGGPGRRDRRHHPVRLGLEADLLGGSDAQAPRVRHPRPSGADHQAGLSSWPGV